MTMGIYCIENTNNGKMYVGKSINIENRFSQHNYYLKKGNHHNIYLQSSYNKHGKKAFTYRVLESVEDIEQLAIKEMNWIDKMGTLASDVGYNLLYDSPSGYVFHHSTLKKWSQNNLGELNPNYGNKWTDEQKSTMSDIAKERHKAGFYGDEWKAKISKASSETWKDEDKKSKMALAVSKARTTCTFYQYDKKTHNLIRKWPGIQAILASNPDWKRQNIYAACNGNKKSYMGFRWERLPNSQWHFLKPEECGHVFDEDDDIDNWVPVALEN